MTSVTGPCWTFNKHSTWHKTDNCGEATYKRHWLMCPRMMVTLMSDSDDDDELSSETNFLQINWHFVLFGSFDFCIHERMDVCDWCCCMWWWYWTCNVRRFYFFFQKIMQLVQEKKLEKHWPWWWTAIFILCILITTNVVNLAKWC